MAATAPFGLILPSRPVLTEPQSISPTQFAFTFPATPQFSHVVIFILPGFTLPDGALAGVYIHLPGSSAGFRLLGALGNDKQSAMFQVKSSRGPSRAESENAIPGGAISAGSAIGSAASDVTVGISIEQATTLAVQLEADQTSQSAHESTAVVPAKSVQSGHWLTTTKLLAQRIIKNAFNFLASFAGSAI